MNKADWPCTDCGEDTQNEYFMIHDDLWPLPSTRYERTSETYRNWFLCIGCLEKRIGRMLCKDDFSDMPINSIGMSRMSERLRDRLKREHGASC